MIALMMAAALGLTDTAIEQRKSELDAAFQAVSAQADSEFQQSVAFHAQLKDERLDFERRLLDERKRMLDALKGQPASRRQELYDEFHVGEARKRQEFRRHEAELKQAFRRRFLDERQDAQRALKRRREGLAEQHRSR